MFKTLKIDYICFMVDKAELEEVICTHLSKKCGFKVYIYLEFDEDTDISYLRLDEMAHTEDELSSIPYNFQEHYELMDTVFREVLELSHNDLLSCENCPGEDFCKITMSPQTFLNFKNFQFKYNIKFF